MEKIDSLNCEDKTAEWQERRTHKKHSIGRDYGVITVWVRVLSRINTG